MFPVNKLPFSYLTRVNSCNTNHWAIFVWLSMSAFSWDVTCRDDNNISTALVPVLLNRKKITSDINVFNFVRRYFTSEYTCSSYFDYSFNHCRNHTLFLIRIVCLIIEVTMVCNIYLRYACYTMPWENTCASEISLLVTKKGWLHNVIAFNSTCLF